MAIELEVQNASGSEAVPAQGDFRQWVSTVLADRGEYSLAIRIVDAGEMQTLNLQYRQQDKPTNVLAFPSEIPESVVAQLPYAPLGDVVLCAPILEREAREQDKPAVNHWAHLTIHGVLHLLGHDHQEQEQAQAMESLERQFLSALGIPDPYGD